MNVPLVYHPNYFSNIGKHVFPTTKFALVYNGLEQQIAGVKRHVHRPYPATRKQLLRVHTPEYLNDLELWQHTYRTYPAELPISEAIVNANYLMTGGTCLAAELALKHGGAMNLGGGFHHAFADKAEGFCYVNDISVAIRHVMSKERAGKKVDRVAVVDTDLHQGNGTAHIFQNDSDVFTFSIHQENNYPIKQKSDIDIGLDDATSDDAYLNKLEQALKTIFAIFDPQLVIYVGGVDPYEQDQLGGLSVTKAGIRRRDNMVCHYCRNHKTPIATVLAGGYAIDVRDTVEMHINTYLAMQETFLVN